MGYSNSILSDVQRLVTPQFVRKIADTLDLSPERAKAGLQATIPTLLMGIFNKASTASGAQSLFNLIRDDSTTGEKVIQNVFGSNLSSVTSRLGAIAGLPSGTILKMLTTLTPVVMGVLSARVAEKGLNAASLIEFVRLQKPVLNGLVPSDVLPEVKEPVANAPITVTKNSKSRMPMSVAAALVLALGLWILLGRRPQPRISEAPPAAVTEQIPEEVQSPEDVVAPEETTSAETLQANEQTVEQPVEEQPATVEANPVMAVVSTNELAKFLASASASELPKRFRFEDLRFGLGGTRLAEGSTSELDQIAASMKNHPQVRARIEGFTDNSGSAEVNERVSQERAEAVKNELVARGVDASRIEVSGLGPVDPVATNDTDSGRAINRRIEFVVLSL